MKKILLTLTIIFVFSQLFAGGCESKWGTAVVCAAGEKMQVSDGD